MRTESATRIFPRRSSGCVHQSRRGRAHRHKAHSASGLSPRSRGDSGTRQCLRILCGLIPSSPGGGRRTPTSGHLNPVHVLSAGTPQWGHTVRQGGWARKSPRQRRKPRPAGPAGASAGQAPLRSWPRPCLGTGFAAPQSRPWKCPLAHDRSADGAVVGDMVRRTLREPSDQGLSLLALGAPSPESRVCAARVMRQTSSPSSLWFRVTRA